MFASLFVMSRLSGPRNQPIEATRQAWPLLTPLAGEGQRPHAYDGRARAMIFQMIGFERGIWETILKIDHLVTSIILRKGFS